MTDNVPSNMIDIIDCIRNDTDKYKVAYSRLKNIEKAYDSVQHFNERVKSYDIAKYSVNDNNLSLVENLKKANAICDDYCHCAHHIVAKEEKEAEFARSILKKYEIDINSASNGVFLPGNKKDKDYSWTISEANHFGGHSKQYLETVNDKLEVVDEFIKNNGLSKEEGRKLICETLDGIRKTLLTGELKIQNTETI